MLLPPLHRAAVVASIVAGGCVAYGCGGDRGGDPVARAVADGLRRQLGVKVESVRCTRDRCDVVLAGGVTMAVRVSGGRDVTWEADEQVRTEVIAAYVRTELVQLGIDAPVDCGPALVATTPGVARVTCRFGEGTAWVDLLPDGGLALEVAVGAEAVRARTEEVDVDELERRSRALDTDEAEGAAAGSDIDQHDAVP
ncbi:MAG TPA: hypothetical protein VM261_24255 [Kofleriaceae bacterium]|nr:hypothetical protein [Kofleriaceae bacterium]